MLQSPDVQQFQSYFYKIVFCPASNADPHAKRASRSAMRRISRAQRSPRTEGAYPVHRRGIHPCCEAAYTRARRAFTHSAQHCYSPQGFALHTPFGKAKHTRSATRRRTHPHAKRAHPSGIAGHTRNAKRCLENPLRPIRPLQNLFILHPQRCVKQFLLQICQLRIPFHKLCRA